MRHTVLFTVLLVMASVAGAVPMAGAAPTSDVVPAAAQESDCSFPYTATDVTGTDVTIEERPERVTTLNPSAAQTMWEIGGKSQVVGTTKYAYYLDGAESRTNVSAGFGVNIEKVVGTRPDLVLAPNTTSVETVEKLRQAGLTVYHFAEATSIEDVEQKTAIIGRLTGNCEGAAKTNAWMTANVRAAKNATADVEGVRALYPLGPSGFVAGGNTFISAMIRDSGGTNVAAEEGITGYEDLSDEVIIQLAPEVLVVTDYTQGIQTTQPYASTPAGQNNATVFVGVNYINQPAPRSVVYTVRNLTTGFHPDVQVDFVAKSEISLAASAQTSESSPTDAATETSTEAETGGQPGFGVSVAIIAALVAALGMRRT